MRYQSIQSARKLFFIVPPILILFFFSFKYLKQPPFFPRVKDPSPSAKSLKRLLKKSEKKLSVNPDDLGSLVNRGVAYFFMGQDYYADSLNSFNNAWRLGVFDKRVFYYSGILYENLSLFEESQKQYERFLRHEPEDREIKLRLARLLFRMGKWDDSIMQYKKLVKKNKSDPTSLINLGLAYQKRYELKLKEKDAYKRNLKDKKKLTTEEIYQNELDLKEAIDYLERASKIQPSLPEKIYLSLAKLYFERGDWEKAVFACESELKKSDEEKEVLQILSSSYEKMGNKEKALETSLKWLEKDPKNSSPKQKIKLLQSQLKKK